MKLTKVKDWFIEQMKELVEEEEKLVAAYQGTGLPADADLKQAKLDGFSDKYLSQLPGCIRGMQFATAQNRAWCCGRPGKVFM